MTPQQRGRTLSLEELELWLASDQAPAKGGWNVSAVDGFLAGVVIGPEPIEPKGWTRLIFGARPLGKDADVALQAVLDRHAAVAKILAEAPARYAPLFMRTDEGVVLAQDWAAGFLAAVRLRLQAWRPLSWARACSASRAAPALPASCFFASKAAVNWSRTALTRWPTAGFCSRGTSR